MADIDRLLVFGDIHSKWDRFQETYRRVDFDPEHDKMVFLGDYLDRGENPVAVMEWVLAHADGTRHIKPLRKQAEGRN